MRPILLLALAGATMAGCTPTVAETERQQAATATTARKLDKALAGLTPGEPTTCLSAIDRRNARSTTSYGSTVLYRIGTDRVYRNDMNGGCNLQGDPILVTQTPSGSLCRGDIVQLIDRGSRFPVGSCAYGDFVPYTRRR